MHHVNLIGTRVKFSYNYDDNYDVCIVAIAIIYALLLHHLTQVPSNLCDLTPGWPLPSLAAATLLVAATSVNPGPSSDPPWPSCCSDVCEPWPLSCAAVTSVNPGCSDVCEPWPLSCCSDVCEPCTVKRDVHACSVLHMCQAALQKGLSQLKVCRFDPLNENDTLHMCPFLCTLHINVH